MKHLRTSPGMASAALDRLVLPGKPYPRAQSIRFYRPEATAKNPRFRLTNSRPLLHVCSSSPINTQGSNDSQVHEDRYHHIMTISSPLNVSGINQCVLLQHFPTPLLHYLIQLRKPLMPPLPSQPELRMSDSSGTSSGNHLSLKDLYDLIFVL